MPLRTGGGEVRVPVPIGAPIKEVALAIQRNLALSGERISVAEVLAQLRTDGYPEDGFNSTGESEQFDPNQIGKLSSIVQNITTNITEKTTQRKASFFDVTTPEQFLDDFEVGFRTFLKSQVESGAITSQDAIFAVLNMDQFQGEYLAELGTRAAAGEDIFELSGLGGDQKKVGERIGEQIKTDTDRVSTTAQGTTADGSTSTQKGTEKIKTSEEFTQIEDITQRPRIGQIAKLSPQDFLTERFGKGLGTFIRATKGQRQRALETQTGPENIGARRI